jgi:hypothetical protein
LPEVRIHIQTQPGKKDGKRKRKRRKRKRKRRKRKRKRKRKKHTLLSSGKWNPIQRTRKQTV